MSKGEVGKLVDLESTYWNPVLKAKSSERA